MQITWFGHSNFRLESEGVTVLIDPFFDGNPSAPVGSELITRADIVLVTHDHGDHVGQAVEICIATGATLVCVYDTGQKLTAQGLPGAQMLGMNLGGTVSVKGVRVKMVQAWHSSASGCASGYILTFPNDFVVYHAGDTALFSDMQLFSRFHDIDLALLPIGGWFTMDALEAAHACAMLGCTQVAPMHWGTFPVLAQNTTAFQRNLKEIAPATTMLECAIGVPMAIALNKD